VSSLSPLHRSALLPGISFPLRYRSAPLFCSSKFSGGCSPHPLLLLPLRFRFSEILPSNFRPFRDWFFFSQTVGSFPPAFLLVISPYCVPYSLLSDVSEDSLSPFQVFPPNSCRAAVLPTVTVHLAVAPSGPPLSPPPFFFLWFCAPLSLFRLFFRLFSALNPAFLNFLPPSADEDDFFSVFLLVCYPAPLAIFISDCIRR